MSSRSTGIARWSRPSKRWSTGSSPWPPVTSAAGAPSATSRSASSARVPSPARVRASGRFGRHDRCEREQQRHERGDRVVLDELRARGGDEHRVDDERRRVGGEEQRHLFDHAAGVEHPGLGGIDADVGEDRLELRDDEGRGHLVDGGDARRVLGGQRDDRRHAVRSRGREGLQVGLDSGAAATVRAGDRQCSRYHCSPFAGANRIRFNGCDLSPARSTPVAARLAGPASHVPSGHGRTSPVRCQTQGRNLYERSTARAPGLEVVRTEVRNVGRLGR